MYYSFKEGLYRIWCGVNRLGDSGVHTLGDTSAFVTPAGQLLLPRRGKTRMDGVGIVFEFYIANESANDVILAIQSSDIRWNSRIRRYWVSILYVHHDMV